MKLEGKVMTQRPDSDELYERMRKEFFVFAGPCAVESEEHALQVAKTLAEIRDRLGLLIIYKSSFDKANRSKADSYRGLGLKKSLEILAKVKKEFGFPIITDVHTPKQVAKVAEVVDVLQIPAFLCRQTDLVGAAALSGRILHIKKMQGLDPKNLNLCGGEKARALGNHKIILCDRGSQFGHNDLVMDPRSLVWMRDGGKNLVVQDCTHATQYMSLDGLKTDARRGFAATYARAAVAVGVNGLFFEVHNEPSEAQSDAACVWPLEKFEELLVELLAIHKATKGLTNPFLGVAC